MNWNVRQRKYPDHQRPCGEVDSVVAFAQSVVENIQNKENFLHVFTEEASRV